MIQLGWVNLIQAHLSDCFVIKEIHFAATGKRWIIEIYFLKYHFVRLNIQNLFICIYSYQKRTVGRFFTFGSISHSVISWFCLNRGASLDWSGLSHANSLAKQRMLTTYARLTVALASYNKTVSASHVRGGGGHRPPGPLLSASEL